MTLMSGVCFSQGLPLGSAGVAVYCRVSSPGQKDDLASQVAAMTQFCLAGALR